MAVALAPDVIAGLIRDQLASLIDADAWAEAITREAENRALLKRASENWALVEKFLGGIR